MGALPKRRTSKSRQGERRSHLHITPVALVECSQCHEMRMTHRACPACGHYRGMEVLKIQDATKKSGAS
jgi:large subunit ribosomal protein L32